MHKGRSNLLNLCIGPKIDSDFQADSVVAAFGLKLSLLPVLCD